MQDEGLQTHQGITGCGCVGSVGLAAFGHNAMSDLNAGKGVRLYS